MNKHESSPSKPRRLELSPAAAAKRRRRARAREHMLPAERAMLEQLEKLAAEEAASRLRIAYERAHRAHYILVNQAVYGLRAVMDFGICLGGNWRQLSRLAPLALSFDQEQIERLAAVRQADGRHLTVEHLLQLSRIHRESKRMDLLNETLAKGWSLRKLTSVIDGRMGGPGR